jgi:hypothetical protein
VLSINADTLNRLGLDVDIPSKLIKGIVYIPLMTP